MLNTTSMVKNKDLDISNLHEVRIWDPMGYAVDPILFSVYLSTEALDQNSLSVRYGTWILKIGCSGSEI